MGLLEVSGLNKRFGGLHAVRDVSFTVQEGTIKALIGPNGAGKTTLFNLVSGVFRPDAGSVSFQGRQIQGLRPYQVAAAGVARTFQHIRLFPKMSVLETIMIGRHIHSRSGFLTGMLRLPSSWREEKAIQKRAGDILDFLGMTDHAAQEATSLAYGQQRIVELGRALACEPKLLLLDEPAAGLNMKETDGMADLIIRVRALGITVLLVEHDMSLVMNISDEVAVLSYGEKIADDVPLSIQKNREVIRVYLGEEA